MRLIIAGVLALLAGQAHAEWEQITDAGDFGSRVVGNAYVDNDGNWFRFNRDRTLSGGSGGQDLTGRWEFRSGMACFQRQLGGVATPDDCIVVFIDGRNLTTVRDGGRGRQAQYIQQ